MDKIFYDVHSRALHCNAIFLSMREIKPETPEAPWEDLLDGRFDSKRPGHTLWGLFADQRRKVFLAVLLYVIKQSPASLLPLVVGMVVDTLTRGGPTAFDRVLWIAGIYFLLLLQNPLMHTWFVRLMSGALRHMQYNLRSALVERLQQLSFSYHEEKQSTALQTKILRDVDAIDSFCRQLMLTGLNGILVIVYVTIIALVRQPLLAVYFGDGPSGSGVAQIVRPPVSQAVPRHAD